MPLNVPQHTKYSDFPTNIFTLICNVLTLSGPERTTVRIRTIKGKRGKKRKQFDEWTGVKDKKSENFILTL